MQIHHFTPYATDGNIGQAYNKACSLVNDPEDWIVIRDGDTMFLTPDWGRVINDTIEQHGDKYELFGAVTNRIREVHHQVWGMFDNMDLKSHYGVAKLLQESKRAEVKPTISDIAGFFMCFQKKTWDKSPFQENTPIFDRLFTRDVRSNGGRVAVMQGLYVLHGYRLWSEDPQVDNAHLFNF